MFSRLGSRPPRIIIRSTYRGFPTTSNTFTGLTRTYASDSSAFTPPRRVSRSQKYLRRTLLTLFGIGVAYVVDRELHASAINRNIRTAWTVSALHVQCLIARRVSFSLSCVRGRVSVRTHGLALLHAACAIPFFLYTRPLPSSHGLKQLVPAANAFPRIYSADMTSSFRNVLNAQPTEHLSPPLGQITTVSSLAAHTHMVLGRLRERKRLILNAIVFLLDKDPRPRC